MQRKSEYGAIIVREVSILAFFFILAFTTLRTGKGDDRSRIMSRSARSLPPSMVVCVFFNPPEPQGPECLNVALSPGVLHGGVALTSRNTSVSVALTP